MFQRANKVTHIQVLSNDPQILTGILTTIATRKRRCYLLINPYKWKTMQN